MKYIFVKLLDLEKDNEFSFLLGLPTDIRNNKICIKSKIALEL